MISSVWRWSGKNRKVWSPASDTPRARVTRRAVRDIPRAPADNFATMAIRYEVTERRAAEVRLRRRETLTRRGQMSAMVPWHAPCYPIGTMQRGRRRVRGLDRETLTMRVSETEIAWLVGALLVSGSIAGAAYLVVVVLAGG